MSFRMVIGGRVYARSAPPPRSRFHLGVQDAVDVAGRPVSTVEAVPGQRRREIRAGEHFLDPVDGILYLVLDTVDPRLGWATAGFWATRWKVEHDDVLYLARCGLLECAAVRNSPTRRYRTTDEKVLLASLQMAGIKKARDRKKAAEYKRGLRRGK